MEPRNFSVLSLQPRTTSPCHSEGIRRGPGFGLRWSLPEMPEEPQRQIIFQIMIALENLKKIRRKIENASAPFSQGLEKNGGGDQTRTRDLCRDSARKRIPNKGLVS